MSSTGVKFRELDLENTSEVGFVFKSWLGSYKNHALDIPYSMYKQVYQHLLDRIIRRENCVVILAVHPTDPEFIFGFAAVERNSPTLHYIYVKAGDKDSSMRRKGIGTDLLRFISIGATVYDELDSENQFAYTFSTSLGRKFLNARNGRFDRKFCRNELP